MKKVYAGRCQCGSVRYKVTAEVEAFICHCEDCRSFSAAPCTAWGKVHKDSFAEISGDLIEYNSSDAVTWSSCKSCGTAIKYSNTESHPFVDFMLCTLESPADIAPSYHVQIQEKLSWLELADNLPVYLRWRTEQE